MVRGSHRQKANPPLSVGTWSAGGAVVRWSVCCFAASCSPSTGNVAYYFLSPEFLKPFPNCFDDRFTKLTRATYHVFRSTIPMRVSNRSAAAWNGSLNYYPTHIIDSNYRSWRTFFHRPRLWESCRPVAPSGPDLQLSLKVHYQRLPHGLAHSFLRSLLHRLWSNNALDLESTFTLVVERARVAPQTADKAIPRLFRPLRAGSGVFGAEDRSADASSASSTVEVLSLFLRRSLALKCL